MTGSPRSRDPARFFDGGVIPLFVGFGLVIAGVSYLYVLSPHIAFGVVLILFGTLLGILYM